MAVETSAVVSTSDAAGNPRLETQIELLQGLATRLRAVRAAPAALAAPSLATTLGGETRRVLEELQELKVTILATDVQNALTAAAASEKADRSGVRGGLRREARKRKRSQTPETPQPYIAPRAPSIFPLSPAVAPTTLSSLSQLVHDFNATHGRAAQMRVCVPSGRAPHELASPVLLRVRLPDVLTAYLTLDVLSSEEKPRLAHDCALAVEHVAIFGAREKLPPHGQSAFLVFQKMSQQILSMVQSAPRVPPRVLADMLVTYEGVFASSCTACERILSQEGYLPPIARVWREHNGEGSGRWEIRHITCMQQ